MKPQILVIDDNPDIIKALTVLFTLNDMDCHGALSPEEGLRKLQEMPFDLVIQDMNFTADTTSGKEGVALFHQIRDFNPDLPIVLITAWTHLETAVNLVKSGAADYLQKPWNDDKLLITVKNLVELHELQEQQRKVTRRYHQKRLHLEQSYNLCNVQFRSESMLYLLEIATQVAHSDVPILITGPNGTGKEKIAEIIQANSTCQSGPFIKVNAGALPSTLVEAELFGAEAGAYTGSNKQRLGRFEAANRGTLFLDEIGNLPLDGQMKLLRILETGEFERLGSTDTRRTKVRIISATNTNLPQAIAEGRFREDLYYRLNVIELKLPPLKERKEDVLPLAQWFLAEGFVLDSEAQTQLTQYHWPGNVRELQNTIKRAMLLSPDKTIHADSLGIPFHPSKQQNSEELTETDIKQALDDSSGVISEAAKILGLSRSSLYRRMEKFGIERK